jgi:hypothetical protein
MAMSMAIVRGLNRVRRLRCRNQPRRNRLVAVVVVVEIVEVPDSLWPLALLPLAAVSCA